MFVILTDSDLEVSARNLSEFDLKQNILAALNTAKCSMGLEPVEGHDTAVRFNVFLWKGYTLALLEYARIMLEQLHDITWPAVNVSRSDLKEDLDSLSRCIADDFEGEKLGMPPWTRIPGAIQAQIGYLVEINPKYQSKWPFAKPVPLPVDPMGLSYYRG